MKHATLVALISSATLLTGCATRPLFAFDTNQMSSIRTIAVSAPKPTTYFVSTAGVMFIPVPGLSMLAAAVGGAVAGGANAASSRIGNDFDRLVKEKVGDTELNRRFVDMLEAELRAQGYEVKEIDLSEDGMPKIAEDGTGLILKGNAYSGADAIMIAPSLTGYFAAGIAAPFTRSVSTEIRIFKADTLAPIFTENLTYYKAQDPYSYNWYSALVEDLPHAVQGLDEALMGLGPKFRVLLFASRGISPTARTNVTQKTD